MPTWPASLPQAPLIAGYTEQRQPATIRSSMDTGPAKIRRRFTASVQTMSHSLKLTAAQVATLDAFFVSDCYEGALAFDWTHPRTGASVSYRFISAPDIGGPDDGYYAVRLELEILP